MSDLFITDNNLAYKHSTVQLKIYVKNGLIISSSFLSLKKVEEINANLNANEIEATELMLADLKSKETQLSKVNFRANKYLKSNNSSDPTFFYLFYNYTHFVTPCYTLALLIKELEKQVEKITSIKFDLTDELSYFKIIAPNFIQCQNLSYIFRASVGLLLNKWKLKFKTTIYYIIGIINKYIFHKHLFPKSNKKKLLLILYNIAHHHEMLRELLKNEVNQNEVEVDVVHLSWGGDINHSESLNASLKTEFKSYNIIKFRSYNFISHSDFYNSIIRLEPTFRIFKKYNTLSHAEVLYSWIGQMINLAKPDVCLHVGVSDVGRIITDVSRYHKVPTVNLEYGLTFDDPLMSTNIRFTVRACLGTNSVDLWKKRNDPSDYIIPIGFTKLDTATNKIESYDKAFTFKKYNLDIGKKTIFFASTYAMDANKQYDFEKQNLVSYLSELCNKYSWNLLIKKHPLEFDQFLKEILEKNNFPNQIVLEHNEIEILEAVYYSDLITNQMSSIVIEALYLNKPVCYLTNSKHKSLSDYMTPVIKGEIPKFTNMIDFEKYVTSLFLHEAFNTEAKNKLNSIKEKYIYKSDGLASKRLMQIIQALLDEKPHLLNEIN